MPRVIAGSAGGRRLKAPPGQSTRPTSDRVKEALFSTLGDLSGLVVLDLYAGSGGLAIEALSRGAARAVLVEQDRRAAGVIRENLRTAGTARAATVVVGSVGAYCDAPQGGPFDVVLADPPYRTPLHVVAAEITALAEAGALAPDAVVVVEQDRRSAEDPPPLLRHVQDRAYGDTLLRYFAHDAGADLHPGHDDGPRTPEPPSGAPAT